MVDDVLAEVATVRVMLTPSGLCAGARSMQRISRALARYAPPHVTLVNSVEDAELVVLYVISQDAIQYGLDLAAGGKRIAVIQCCYLTASGNVAEWNVLWRCADVVWSYLSLQREIYPPLDSVNLYYAPLGLDDAFTQPFDLSAPREPLCVTTGYCDGPGAEAISEVWKACSLVGLRCFHVGPNKVEGMHTQPDNWTARERLTDEELAALYRRASHVCALRHVEGFELPAAEGASMGAIPIVFNQPAMIEWYGDIGVFVPDFSGKALVNRLTEAFHFHRDREELSATARERFNWQTICTEFWRRLQC